jgi:hypothetical protein
VGGEEQWEGKKRREGKRKKRRKGGEEEREGKREGGGVGDGDQEGFEGAPEFSQQFRLFRELLERRQELLALDLHVELCARACL